VYVVEKKDLNSTFRLSEVEMPTLNLKKNMLQAILKETDDITYSSR